MWIDSHCHLNHPRIQKTYTPEELVNNALENDVIGMLNISCQVKGDFPQVLETARKFKNVWCTVGTHPHNAGDSEEQKVTQEELVKLAKSDENIVGIGETGLDYYYNNAPKDVQKECFRKHIRTAIETNLPVVIHARDADEDIARILFDEEGAGTKLRGVMHCFSSSPELAYKALDFGFYISFSGIVTFKNAHDLQNLAKEVPLDRMLIETDAPFLAPDPYRGKINQPAYVLHVGAALAEINKVDEERIAKHSKENFFRLFSKASL